MRGRLWADVKYSTIARVYVCVCVVWCVCVCTCVGRAGSTRLRPTENVRLDAQTGEIHTCVYVCKRSFFGLT